MCLIYGSRKHSGRVKVKGYSKVTAVFILELELLESNDSFTKFWWDI